MLQKTSFENFVDVPFPLAPNHISNTPSTHKRLISILALGLLLLIIKCLILSRCLVQVTTSSSPHFTSCLVCRCRIHKLHLCIGVRPLLNECLGHDAKPTDGEASVLEIWGMWSVPSLLLLLEPLWPWVVVSVGVPSMGQIELLNHLTVCKQITGVKLNC